MDGWNTPYYLLYSMSPVLYLFVRFVFQIDSSARGFYSMFYMLMRTSRSLVSHLFLSGQLGLWVITLCLIFSSLQFGLCPISLSLFFIVSSSQLGFCFITLYFIFFNS